MTEQFHWTSPNGIEIVIPRIGKLKASVLRRHRTKQGDDYIFSILEDIADDGLMAKIDELDVDEMNDFSEKWTATAGESTRSST